VQSARDRLRECRRDGCLRLPRKSRGRFGNDAGRGCRGWHPESSFVKEGQYVKRGTLLGEIGCDDLQASLQTATAEADGARQARTRILRGARDEEKKIASEKTAAARATLKRPSRGSRCSELFIKRNRSPGPHSSRLSRDLGVSDANLKAAVRTEEFTCCASLAGRSGAGRCRGARGGGSSSNCPGTYREVLNPCSDRRNRLEGICQAR